MRKLLSPFREDSSSISTNNRKVQSSWRVEKKLYNFFIISRLKLLRIRLEIRSWNFSKDIKKEKKNRRKKNLGERIEEMAPLSRPGQTWLIRYSSIEISPAALSIHGSRNHHKTRWKSATLGGRHCTIHRVPRGEGRVTNEYAAEERGKRRKLRFRVAMEGEGGCGNRHLFDLLFSFLLSNKGGFRGEQLLLSTSSATTFRKNRLIWRFLSWTIFFLNNFVEQCLWKKREKWWMVEMKYWSLLTFLYNLVKR